ncbi:hypothetical protein HDU76_008481 [Blyttiomyces sp. JEL0837]|nr:hypothetical protein HDU76_008481 [Blyttiomyces sp. JEL0837]
MSAAVSHASAAFKWLATASVNGGGNDRRRTTTSTVSPPSISSASTTMKGAPPAPISTKTAASNVTAGGSASAPAGIRKSFSTPSLTTFGLSDGERDMHYRQLMMDGKFTSTAVPAHFGNHSKSSTGSATYSPATGHGNRPAMGRAGMFGIMSMWTNRSVSSMPGMDSGPMDNDGGEVVGIKTVEVEDGKRKPNSLDVVIAGTVGDGDIHQANMQGDNEMVEKKRDGVHSPKVSVPPIITSLPGVAETSPRSAHPHVAPLPDLSIIRTSVHQNLPTTLILAQDPNKDASTPSGSPVVSKPTTNNGVNATASPVNGASAWEQHSEISSDAASGWSVWKRDGTGADYAVPGSAAEPPQQQHPLPSSPVVNTTLVVPCGVPPLPTMVGSSDVVVSRNSDLRSESVNKIVRSPLAPPPAVVVVVDGPRPTSMSMSICTDSKVAKKEPESPYRSRPVGFSIPANDIGPSPRSARFDVGTVGSMSTSTGPSILGSQSGVGGMDEIEVEGMNANAGEIGDTIDDEIQHVVGEGDVGEVEDASVVVVVDGKEPDVVDNMSGESIWSTSSSPEWKVLGQAGKRSPPVFLPKTLVRTVKAAMAMVDEEEDEEEEEKAVEREVKQQNPFVVAGTAAPPVASPTMDRSRSKSCAEVPMEESTMLRRAGTTLNSNLTLRSLQVGNSSSGRRGDGGRPAATSMLLVSEELRSLYLDIAGLSLDELANKYK